MTLQHCSRCLFLFLALFLQQVSPASEVKSISTYDGLTSSAVYSVTGDDLGRLWIGTADGLHIWNGHGVELFSPADGWNYFSGNTIRSICHGRGNDIWLRSDYGIARVDTRTCDTDFYDRLAFSFAMTSCADSLIYIIGNDRKLYRYSYCENAFNPYGTYILPESANCIRAVAPEPDYLYCFTGEGIYGVRVTADDVDGGKITTSYIRKSETGVVYATEIMDDGKCWFVSRDNGLYCFLPETGETEFVADMKGIFPEYEEIRSILPAEDGLNIGFSSSGLYFLSYDSIEDGRPELTPTLVKSGIFCTYRDRFQPIVWVGTDGQGLLRWVSSSVGFDSITYNELPYSIKMPARSIFIDRENDLWIGTKGDGIIILEDYRPNKYYDKLNTVHYTAENSELVNNNIYTLTDSRHGFIWIGSDGPGLNCLAFRDDSLRKVPGSDGITGGVHSLLETNDSTIWLTADYDGLYKCTFYMRKDGVPVIRRIEKPDIPFSSEKKDRIFTMTAGNDSILWLGTRGQGAIRYDMSTGVSSVIRFPVDKGYATNVISCISVADRVLFATGSGLVAYDSRTGESMVSEDVPKRMIHAMLQDGLGNVWLSTNTGIIFMSGNNHKIFNQNYGMQVIEFSDGACFRDTVSGTLFFGGVNGIVSIMAKRDSVQTGDIYMPDIHLLTWDVDGRCSDLRDLKDGERFSMHYSKAPATLEISVIDNINYPDYEFFYSLDGNGDDWTSNGNEDIISLPVLSPGLHRLKIKYQNNASSSAVREYSMQIYVIPPVYARWWAIMSYVLILIAGGFLAYRHFKGKYAFMQETMKRRYADGIRRAKSEIIGNITEELSVLVTFILSVCQQLRHEGQTPEEISEKTRLIEHNADKINRIMYIMNEYGRMQEISGGDLSLIPVSQISAEIISLIKSNADSRNIRITTDIPSDLVWAIDKNIWLTLFNILMSASVESAADDSGITVSMHKGKDGLDAGISFPCRPEIFQSLQKVLEKNTVPEIRMREGNNDILLDFIIVREKAASLGWTMSAECDDDGGMVRISMLIPDSAETPSAAQDETMPAGGISSGNAYPLFTPPQSPDARLENIFLVSRNGEIVGYFIHFMDGIYNVYPFPDSHQATGYLDENIPAFVIYDVTSGKTDELKMFMDALKDRKMTGNVQTVALISGLRSEERYECTRLGVDLCISFPFNIDYLKTSLKRLSDKKYDMGNYYNSPQSAFVINNSHILHVDDKKFIDRLLETIDENISDPELSVAVLADRMQTSVRVLYRRLEGITEAKPQKIIRDRRMRRTARLLTSSKDTVDEIMYKVGYENRSTFYKNFRETYGMTPTEFREQIRKDFNF